MPAEIDPQDLTLAETLASQAAVAVANALLVERLQAKLAKLRLLQERLLHVQEAERRRLAEDLHDSALHTVLGIVRQAETATGRLAGSDLSRGEVLATSIAALQGLAECGRDAAYELREACSRLYPSELTHLGLPAALEVLAQRMGRDENLNVQFSRDSFPEDRRLPPVIEGSLYRVAREALDNARRHSGTETARVDLALEGNWIELTLSGDGRGFVVPSSLASLLRKGHLGLASTRNRIERLGGEFAVDSATGQGTRVRVRIKVPDCHGTAVTPQPEAQV